MSGLPIWLNATLCAVAALAGVWFGRRAHRREPISDASRILKHSPHLILVALSPLALLVFHITFHFRPELEWSLPYPVQYFYGPFSWGLILIAYTYFAGFGGAVILMSHHPKRWHLGVALALLFIAIQQYHLQATSVEPAESLASRIEPGGYVYQSHPSTCAAAATATLLALRGDPRSEEEMIRLLGTDSQGTSPSQLVMAMRKLGFREQTIDVDREGFTALKAPSVVYLAHNVHAITLESFTRDGAYIWDPSRGRYFYTRAELKRLLTGAHAFYFEPRPETKKSVNG